ncbi:hypothetical protein [Shewanella indica]|uniref:hypothetical protein n=1 Tax=Shewanella indica TaxID=768528 RepID=UPI0030079BDB
MNIRQIKLKQKIARSLGVAESEAYFDYQFHDPAPFGESARALMREVPPSFGSCVMLSCAWASYLKDHFSIPAIVVAGDLKISGARIFKYKEKLPEPSGTGKIVQKSWGGHCWIEVNGYLGDLSIFRTAYSISGRSILRDYILDRFGPGRGALLSPVEDLPDGMQYIPQYVLKDAQVDMFTASLGYQLKHGI